MNRRMIGDSFRIWNSTRCKIAAEADGTGLARCWVRAAASLVVMWTFSLPVFAQVQNGTIAGTVTDPQGAVVPAANVTLTQAATGLMLHGQSNAQGLYSFPQLPPGEYKVEVNKQGFRKAVTILTLTVGQVAQVDIVLPVGSENETVTVEGENASALDTATSNLDYTVQSQQVDDLPLNGRNPYGLAVLSPGIAAGTDFGVGVAVTRGAVVAAGTNNFESNGGIGGSNDILLDGVSIVVCCQGQPAVTPSTEIVSQFKVVTSDPPAEYGRTSGAVLNIATKSGTNSLRGEIYDFLRNDKLDAANFFTKRSGIYPYPGIDDFRPPHRENQFGVFTGGPIVFPHIYNGKDKTFFAFGYEGIRNLDPTTGTVTVPTALMRQGIFTEAPAPVYNPTSYNATTGQRTPISAATCNGTPYAAGYCIPSSEFNPVATALLPLFPSPNLPGTVNNYEYVENLTDADDQFNFRIDHNFSDAQRSFVRFTHDSNVHANYDLFNNPTGPSGWNQTLGAWLFAAEHVWTLSSTTLLQFSYGFARQTNYQVGNNFFKFDAANYGFSNNFTSEQQVPGLPYVTISGLQGLGLSVYSPVLFNHWAHYTHSLNAGAMLQRGKHSISTGYNGQLVLENELGLSDPLGTFGFNTQYTGGPSPNSSLPSGQSAFDSWAAFLLGYPGTGTLSRQDTVALSQWVTGLYFQDDWHLFSRLTLNLGLRWDVETGFMERHDHWADFNPTITSPLSSEVGFNVLGGAEFLGYDGNPSRTWPTYYHKVAPRVGFSYALTGKDVIRGGYGILYLPTSENIYIAGNIGFTQTTSIPTSANGFTPVVTTDNPFPSGVALPAGPAAGVGVSAGSTISGLAVGNPASYQQQWNFGVERSLARNMSATVTYVGGHGVDLPLKIRPNDLYPAYFGTPGDTAQVSYLEAQVSNPFAGASGISPGSSLLNSTVERAQLLTPFPQYTAGSITSIQNSSVAINYTDHGSATYNALQATWLINHQGGLTGSVSYIWSKLLGNVSDLINGSLNPTGNPGIQNLYFMHQYEHSNLATDIPQHIVGTATYPIPLGTGKALGSGMPRWANEVVGGWTVTALADVYSGFPPGLTVAGNPAFSGTRPVYMAGVNPLTSGPTHQRLGGTGQTQGYFNPAAFTLPQSFQLGDVPRSAAALRGPLSFDDNASIIKDVSIHEDFGLEFRAEAFNLLNKVDFALPATTFGATGFGYITSQNNLPRNIQLSMKIRF